MLNLIKDNIENLFLVIAIVIFVIVLIGKVVFSPNKVEISNRPYSVSQVDKQIDETAKRLERAFVTSEPKPSVYDPCFGKFQAMIDAPFPNENAVVFPLPIHSQRAITDNRKYMLPEMCDVCDVAVSRMRTVAYLPEVKIDPEHAYCEQTSAAGELDLVTVSASIDVVELYRRFEESFNSETIDPQWRDEDLATPVFSAVQLQRQVLNDDGTWSKWQIVPKVRIDHRKNMFDIPEAVDDLPVGGMMVQMLRFNNDEVLLDLLQPQAYEIALAGDRWYLPLLYSRYEKYKADSDVLDRRQDILDRRQKKLQEKQDRLRKKESEKEGRQSTPRDDYMMLGGRMDDSAGGGGGGGYQGQRRSTRLTDKDKDKEDVKQNIDNLLEGLEKVVGEIDADMEKMVITGRDGLLSTEQKMTFWAFDDDVTVGDSYRYRMKLAVFNPIAGTDQLEDSCKDKKNNTFLWTAYSEITAVIKVPLKLYFFPIDQKTHSTVTKVKVCKYFMGYWYSNEFKIDLGEYIGGEIKYIPSDYEVDQQIDSPEKIDFSTNAFVVDVVSISDFAGKNNMRQRKYSNMLYSFDGNFIESTPIKPNYWSGQIRNDYSRINKLLSKKKENLVDWGQNNDDRRSTPASDRFGGPGDYEMMMRYGM